MKIKLAGILTGSLLFLIGISASAHHPFAAEFDWKKPVTLTGTVTKFEWENPHTHLYIDSKDASGSIKKWTLELGSPQALTGLGWKQSTLKVGDTVTVDGWLAKDGSNNANLKSAKLPGGKELMAGSSFVDALGNKTDQKAGN